VGRLRMRTGKVVDAPETRASDQFYRTARSHLT
jgi:hypothetical protein